MKRYNVEIIETLCRVVEVKAECIDDAIEQIDDQYREVNIVLDNTDFQDVRIDAI